MTTTKLFFILTYPTFTDTKKSKKKKVIKFAYLYCDQLENFTGYDNNDNGIFLLKPLFIFHGNDVKQ